MKSFESRLDARSKRKVLSLIKNDLYGLVMSRLRVLDLSPAPTDVAEQLKKMGIVVQRLTHGMEVREPLDLILYDGAHPSELHLPEILETFQPGIQLLMWNVELATDQDSNSQAVRPEEFGLFKEYPLTGWTDMLWGRTWARWVERRPVIKVRSVRVV